LLSTNSLGLLRLQHRYDTKYYQQNNIVCDNNIGMQMVQMDVFFLAKNTRRSNMKA